MFYDPMIAKVCGKFFFFTFLILTFAKWQLFFFFYFVLKIGYGANREEAISRLINTLDSYVVRIACKIQKNIFWHFLTFSMFFDTFDVLRHFRYFLTFSMFFDTFDAFLTLFDIFGCFLFFSSGSRQPQRVFSTINPRAPSIQRRPPHNQIHPRRMARRFQRAHFDLHPEDPINNNKISSTN